MNKKHKIIVAVTGASGAIYYGEYAYKINDPANITFVYLRLNTITSPLMVLILHLHQIGRAHV